MMLGELNSQMKGTKLGPSLSHTISKLELKLAEREKLKHCTYTVRPPATNGDTQQATDWGHNVLDLT